MNSKTKFAQVFGARHWGSLICLFVVLISTGTVQAVEFRLKKGGQFELCRDMAENLKAYPDLLPNPFDMPFDPALGKFRWVEWEPLDPLEHVDVIRQAVITQGNFTNRKTPEEMEVKWKKEKPVLLEKARTGNLYLEQASFDANHDGEHERVYRFSHDTYKWPAIYDPRSWTLAWYLLVMPEDDPKTSRQLAGAVQPGQPFYHKGRIFYWSAASKLVLEPNQLDASRGFFLLDVCVFKPIID